jgi:hypothetical protein
MDWPERRAVRARTITIRKARFGAGDERLDREFRAELTPEIPASCRSPLW